MSRHLRLRNHSRGCSGYGRPVLKKVSPLGVILIALNADPVGNGPAVLRLVIHYLTINEGELYSS